jgi:hypothetical protein
MSTRTSQGSGRAVRTPDAIALLTADHRAVEALSKPFASARPGDRKEELVHRICLELSVQAQIEEEIVYPACAGAVEEAMLNQAYVEHDGAKVLIAELLEADATDAFFEARVTVLAEMREMGERLAARNTAFAAAFEKRGVPTPEARATRRADALRGAGRAVGAAPTLPSAAGGRSRNTCSRRVPKPARPHGRPPASR